MATKQKTQRVGVWLTPELRAHLEQILAARRKYDPSTKLSDVLREALRAFVDQEEEILGSKAHQVKTFKRVADDLSQQLIEAEERLSLLLSVILQLMTIASTIQIKHLQQKDLDPQRLIETAIKSAVGDKGLATLQDIQALAEQLGKRME
jgi:hypothetical protein